MVQLAGCLIGLAILLWLGVLILLYVEDKDDN